MARDSYCGSTPEEAIQTFIEKYCQEIEHDETSYRYDGPSIIEDHEHERADLQFRFTRREQDTGEPVHRRFTGYVYQMTGSESSDTIYEIRHWNRTVEDNNPPPKSPGKTPHRLRGRRPRDTRY